MNTFFTISNILLFISYWIWVFVLIKQNSLLKKQNNYLKKEINQIFKQTTRMGIMDYITNTATIEWLEEILEMKKKEKK